MRPIHGCTPRVRKKFPETYSPLRVSTCACDPALRTPRAAFPACNAAKSVNSGVRARKFLYASHENSAKSPSFPCVYPPQLQQRILSPMRHSSSGFDTGRDFSITWCTSVKIAVVAPIPSASVTTAVVVNPGTFRSCRSASRKSASIRPSSTVSDSESPKCSTRTPTRRFPENNLPRHEELRRELIPNVDIQPSSVQNLLHLRLTVPVCDR